MSVLQDLLQEADTNTTELRDTDTNIDMNNTELREGNGQRREEEVNERKLAGEEREGGREGGGREGEKEEGGKLKEKEKDIPPTLTFPHILKLQVKREEGEGGGRQVGAKVGRRKMQLFRI